LSPHSPIATTLGMLHYDHDCDLITEKTDLTLDSVWLAARGTL
jgi:hypothetical protein